MVAQKFCNRTITMYLPTLWGEYSDYTLYGYSVSQYTHPPSKNNDTQNNETYPSLLFHTTFFWLCKMLKSSIDVVGPLGGFNMVTWIQNYSKIFTSRGVAYVVSCLAYSHGLVSCVSGEYLFIKWLSPAPPFLPTHPHLINTTSDTACSSTSMACYQAIYQKLFNTQTHTMIGSIRKL